MTCDDPTLFDGVGSDVRWKEALGQYARIAEAVRPEDALRYDILHMCLTAFHLARAFYSGAFATKADPDDPKGELKRLVHIGNLASSFRSVFFQIGMYRLGTKSPGPNSRQQSLNELEACHRWLKRKGLMGWRVCKYNHVAGSQQSEWVEVGPAEFVSKILAAYDAGKEALAKLQEEYEKKKSGRCDKYDPENGKEAK